MSSGDFLNSAPHTHDNQFTHWAFSPALLKIFICGCFILAVLNWAQACSVLGIDLTTELHSHPWDVKDSGTAALLCPLLFFFFFSFSLWLWECDCSLHVLSPSELWDHNFWGLNVEIYVPLQLAKLGFRELWFSSRPVLCEWEVRVSLHGTHCWGPAGLVLENTHIVDLLEPRGYGVLGIPSTTVLSVQQSCVL